MIVSTNGSDGGGLKEKCLVVFRVRTMKPWAQAKVASLSVVIGAVVSGSHGVEVCRMSTSVR